MIIEACKDNPWLMDEEDYPTTHPDYMWHNPVEVEDLKKLAEHFSGFWCIRTTFIYKSLAFVQQVDGSDEWLTLKITENGLYPFNSCSFWPSLERNKMEFYKDVLRMDKASLERCLSLKY